MSKTKSHSKSSAKRASKKHSSQELDGVFLLKLVLYMILGSLWVKISHNGTLSLPVPFGLLMGLFFTTHEHFQIDKKIEYAVLLVAMLVGYFAPFGLYIAY